MLSLIDAHEVYLIDVCFNNEELYHQDIYISTSEESPSKSIYQSALEFVLKNPKSQLQISKMVDEYQNEGTRLILENWEKNSKLICNRYNVKDYSASYKQSFAKFLSAHDITPLKDALEHFPEFLGASGLDEDSSSVVKVTLEKDKKFLVYSLKTPRSLTDLMDSLVNLAFQRDGSLIFKVNPYPYFELQYPDLTTTGIWLDIYESEDSDFQHELEGF